MSDALRLFGTRVIVTAAADGIGEAIVRTFVKQGAEIVAIDAPDSGIDRVFRGLRNVTPLASSMADPQTVKALVKEARDEFGGIDVVINNGYLQPGNPIEDSDKDALDTWLDRKIGSYSVLARAALPYLEQSPAGRIVNIGCLRSAFAIDATRALRRSEKSLAELTATLAGEMGSKGTSVTYLQPGAIMTPDSRRVFSADKALRDHCIRNSAVGRVGDPVDIAKVALFLASDDSVFMTGTGVIVDGGARATAV